MIQKVWIQFSRVVIMMLVCSPIVAIANDGTGAVDGAIWVFSLKRLNTAVSGAVEMRYGGIQVRGADILQPKDVSIFLPKNRTAENTDPKNVEMVQIGKKDPRSVPNRTILIFDSLTTAVPGKIHEPMKGQAILFFDKLGAWNGRLIDSDGFHWEFKARRFRE